MAAPVLQTYASDFHDRMRDTHAATATVLAAEQDAGRSSHAAEAPKKGALPIFAGIILLVLGGIGLYYAYSWYIARQAPVFIAAPALAPIFVNERQEVAGSGAELLYALTQALDRPLAAGAVRHLYMTGSSTNVFLALQLPAPDILLRNIREEPSMAGVVSVDAIQSPFFILPAASYSDTFAGMLSWERNMPRDLATLYPPYPITASTTIATSPSPGFADEVIGNHDARVYRDASGRALITYGYWNQSTLVIARDTAAFAEIVSRLATSRTQAE